MIGDFRVVDGLGAPNVSFNSEWHMEVKTFFHTMGNSDLSVRFYYWQILLLRHIIKVSVEGAVVARAGKNCKKVGHKEWPEQP